MTENLRSKFSVIADPPWAGKQSSKNKKPSFYDFCLVIKRWFGFCEDEFLPPKIFCDSRSQKEKGINRDYLTGKSFFVEYKYPSYDTQHRHCNTQNKY